MGPKLIVDTREKKCLSFNDSVFEDIIYRKLETGDYSIEGMEDILFIERKGLILEFYKNMREERFWAELDRTRNHKYKFLIVQFDLESVYAFPHGCKIPPKIADQLKMGKEFLLKNIMKTMIDYGVHFMFTSNERDLTRTIEKICKYVYEKETKLQRDNR